MTYKLVGDISIDIKPPPKRTLLLEIHYYANDEEISHRLGKIIANHLYDTGL